MSTGKTSFTVWANRLVQYGLADRVTKWWMFGRKRLLVIVCWEGKK